MKPLLRQAGLVLLLSMTVASCTNDLTGTTYSATEARHVQNVRFGTIVESRLVKLEGTDGEIGTLAGAAVGGIAASGIGGEKESTIAAVAGAVAGGVLGRMAEKKMTTKQGIELTVKLQNGSFISVVQEASPAAPFAPGDEVKVLSHGKTTRVVKLQ